MGVVKSTVIFIANEVSQAKLRKLMDQVCFKSLFQKPRWFWKMKSEMNSEWQFPFALWIKFASNLFPKNQDDFERWRVNWIQSGSFHSLSLQ